MATAYKFRPSVSGFPIPKGDESYTPIGLPLKRGIPYSLEEAEIVANTQLRDIYHRELMLELVAEVRRLKESRA